MDPTESGLESAAAEEHARDQRVLLSGTLQNISGLAVFAIASFGMNILLARAFGKGSNDFGVITLLTQGAFIAGAGTRFGMDMAAVRRVAIEAGQGALGKIRATVRMAAGMAGALSAVVAVILVLAAGPVSTFFKIKSNTPVRIAAIALVFVAVSQVYMGASRGLKIMRHTLYGYWVGQSVGWIVLTLVFWSVWQKTIATTVLAYAASWVLATVIATISWRSASRSFPHEHAEPGEAGELVRYGAPRAPAALLSQALFYADYFVLAHVLPSGDQRLSVYAACLRAVQALVLFLTAVANVFAPFVADLHHRGERDRLNELFKQITRWTIAGTIPLLLLFATAPGSVLRVYGGSYGQGSAWLRILLIGYFVNVSVGAAGFVLIMAGRTVWDLLVYAGSVVLDVVVASIVAPHLGPLGAAMAQTIALTVSNIVRVALVWKFVRIQPYDRNYARLAIPTGICAVAMIAIHSVLDGGPKWGVDLLGTGILGGLVYYVALLTVGLKDDERAAVLRFVKRGRPRTVR